MLISEDPKVTLEHAVSKGLIRTPEANLRSKVASISATLELLEKKKARIDYEIRKQKSSLVRKRQELVRASKSFKSKSKVLRESEVDSPVSLNLETWISKYDAKILQESARILDQD